MALLRPHTNFIDPQAPSVWRPICQITSEQSCPRWRKSAGWPFCLPNDARSAKCIHGHVETNCRGQNLNSYHGGARPTASGAWSLSAQYSYSMDVGLAHSLARLFTGHTVVELGAGLGCYTGFLRDHGTVGEVIGFDGAEGVHTHTHGLVSQADLTRRDLDLPKADWTLCLEVAEHIPPELEADFLSNVNATSRFGLVLSWSNGWGNGHVNVRGPEYVINMICKLGFQHDKMATRALQGATTDFWWFQTSLQVFRRPTFTPRCCDM